MRKEKLPRVQVDLPWTGDIGVLAEELAISNFGWQAAAEKHPDGVWRARPMEGERPGEGLTVEGIEESGKRIARITFWTSLEFATTFLGAIESMDRDGALEGRTTPR